MARFRPSLRGKNRTKGAVSSSTHLAPGFRLLPLDEVKMAVLSGGSSRSDPLNRDLRLGAAWRSTFPAHRGASIMHARGGAASRANVRPRFPLSHVSHIVVVVDRRALPGWGILPIPELPKSTTFVGRIRCGRVRRFLLSCPLEPSTALPQGPREHGQSTSSQRFDREARNCRLEAGATKSPADMSCPEKRESRIYRAR